MQIGIRQNASTVEYLTLMTTDVTNIENFVVYLSYLVVGPIKASCIMIVLINRISLVMLSGLIVFFMLIPFQMLTSRIFGVFK
jgi:hypothetical protein